MALDIESSLEGGRYLDEGTGIRSEGITPKVQVQEVAKKVSSISGQGNASDNMGYDPRDNHPSPKEIEKWWAFYGPKGGK